MTRTRQNWIGTRTDTPVGAEFIPPPPESVEEALSDLASFINRVDVAPLTQAAVAHAQFETIHPYPDDLRIPSGNRLEKLKGNRRGQRSIRINQQWRICFRWTDAGAEDVQIVDCH